MGDALPFGIVVIAIALAFPLPKVMAVVAVCWFAFVTVGLLVNAKSLRVKRDEAVIRGMPAGASVLQLWALFNIPTALVLLIAFLRW